MNEYKNWEIFREASDPRRVKVPNRSPPAMVGDRAWWNPATPDGKRQGKLICMARDRIMAAIPARGGKPAAYGF
jgi:hypothetical protein